jgi:hypothetical protein
MMITPQARRRITGAVRELDDPSARDRWSSWAATAPSDQHRTNVPYEIAAIALRALETAEKNIHQALGLQELDEDTRVDLANDLGYVQAIETAIRNEGIGR